MGNERGARAFQNARLRKKLGADPAPLFARALALHQAGQIADAQALYRQVLQLQPNHTDALQFLAVAEYQSGRAAEADRLFQRALAIGPRSATLHSNRSLALYELGRFGDAVASCDAALTIKPDYAEAHCNRANALRALGRHEEALAGAERAIALRPINPEAYDVRGSALVGLRRFEEALESYDRSLALRPAQPMVLANRGSALFERARYGAAIESFELALTLKPDLIDALLGRANARLHSGQPNEAIADCNRALAINPNSCGAITLLGQCYEKQADLPAAIAHYERALAIQPDFACALANRIFALDFTPGSSFLEQWRTRSEWWHHVGSKLAVPPQPFPNSRDSERRLVLGYVSSDFRSHSIAFILKPVLRNHDRSRFEVVCYSCSPLRDSVTEEFYGIADRWRDASQWSDARLADEIRADQVDILVDLSGHTAGNRLGVFARKPAPIQVTAWGHSTSTGMPMMDYLLSDPVATPAAARHLFTEEIYDLPCVLATEPAPAHLHRAEPPLVRNGYVTYGVFNRISKISDETIVMWVEILRQDSCARLLIKHKALDQASVRDTLTARFAARNIGSDRIDYLGSTTRDQHLAAHKDVDICLDPFPLNGGVSTWEALQMGVPVVARLGNSIVSRVAGSIMTSVGLPAFVGETAEDYVRIALDFAARPAELAELRRTLPERIATSVAGNPVAYAKSIDDAYAAMWRRFCTEKITKSGNVREAMRPSSHA